MVPFWQEENVQTWVCLSADTPACAKEWVWLVESKRNLRDNHILGFPHSG